MDHFYYQGHCCQLLTGQLTCQVVSESLSSDFIAFHIFPPPQELYTRVSEPVFHPVLREIPGTNPAHKLWRNRWGESQHESLLPEQPRGNMKYKKRYGRDVHVNRWGFACMSLSDTSKIFNGEWSSGKATGHLWQREEKKKKPLTLWGWLYYLE